MPIVHAAPSRTAARLAAIGLGIALSGACGERATRADAQQPAAQAARPRRAATPSTATRDTAIFASGCFWCSEADFQKVPGVIDAVSGYTGGQLANPTYEQVSAGGTGHYEAVRVVFDPRRVRYAQLLDAFWRNVDPVDGGGQFCDRGESYRAAIFPRDAEQQRLAAASKQALERSRRFPQPITVAVVPASAFYPAEAYHQEYANRNPLRYRFYRTGCGRDARLRSAWGEAAGH
jgi:peptide-methionine (S)-S-oxide reductase